METIRPKTRAAVLKIAEWQEGVVEMPSGSNKVKYNTAYYGHKVSGASYAWCMAFVWWVFREAGFNLFKTASCTKFVEQYKKVSPQQVVTTNFKPGDLVFFDFTGKKKVTAHVGIVARVSADGKTVYTYEGNTSGGNDANGGAVQLRTRSIKVITVAVRPNYSE